jgi:hypothetical protein
MLCDVSVGELDEPAEVEVPSGFDQLLARRPGSLPELASLDERLDRGRQEVLAVVESHDRLESPKQSEVGDIHIFLVTEHHVAHGSGCARGGRSSTKPRAHWEPVGTVAAPLSRPGQTHDLRERTSPLRTSSLTQIDRNEFV